MPYNEKPAPEFDEEPGNAEPGDDKIVKAHVTPDGNLIVRFSSGRECGFFPVFLEEAMMEIGWDPMPQDEKDLKSFKWSGKPVMVYPVDDEDGGGDGEEEGDENGEEGGRIVSDEGYTTPDPRENP